jgi:hypothetical protein
MWSAAPAATPRRSPKLIEDSARGNWENLGILAAACGVTVTGLLLMKEMAPRILLLGALLSVALAGIGASSPASGRRARRPLGSRSRHRGDRVVLAPVVCPLHRTRRMGLPVLLPQRPGRGSWIELLRPWRLRRGVPADLDTLRTESRVRERVSERHLPLSTPDDIPVHAARLPGLSQRQHPLARLRPPDLCLVRVCRLRSSSPPTA